MHASSDAYTRRSIHASEQRVITRILRRAGTWTRASARFSRSKRPEAQVPRGPYGVYAPCPLSEATGPRKRKGNMGVPCGSKSPSPFFPRFAPRLLSSIPALRFSWSARPPSPPAEALGKAGGVRRTASPVLPAHLPSRAAPAPSPHPPLSVSPLNAYSTSIAGMGAGGGMLMARALSASRSRGEEMRVRSETRKARIWQRGGWIGMPLCRRCGCVTSTSDAPPGAPVSMKARVKSPSEGA
mmetsp:Transcript_15709/g.37944  ORF Transcript_15709/g.37944 Transcript_15709/m.37944 type:complete len:241 (-) Transcript_15709:793-1515(-)